MKTKPKKKVASRVKSGNRRTGAGTVKKDKKNVLVEMVGLARDITSDVPKDVWEGLPRDLAKNVDHYLYGKAKREKE